VRGDPETFFGAEGVIEREGIGAVHHLVWVEREELL
jgi:hypothetical protein